MVRVCQFRHSAVSERGGGEIRTLSHVRDTLDRRVSSRLFQIRAMCRSAVLTAVRISNGLLTVDRHDCLKKTPVPFTSRFPGIATLGPSSFTGLTCESLIGPNIEAVCGSRIQRRNRTFGIQIQSLSLYQLS